jgi:hypothetical protein
MFASAVVPVLLASLVFHVEEARRELKGETRTGEVRIGDHIRMH